MKVIQNENMPLANGHYSTCISHNGLIYLSGQLPFAPGTREMPEGIEAQTIQALSNVLTIVNAAGSELTDIIQMRLYIPDVHLWDQVNKVYSDFFGNHRPVRTVVPSRDLHFGSLIEIEAIAVAHEV